MDPNGNFDSVLAQVADSYAPYLTVCPSTPLVRKANGQISGGERHYVAHRQPRCRQAFIEAMDRWEFSDVRQLLQNDTVTVAIAISGGGYRAMLTGAGFVSALDDRTPGATGHLGGVLQAATYMAGASGGSWLVAHDLLNDGRPLWESVQRHRFDTPLVEGMPDLPVVQLRASLDAPAGGAGGARADTGTLVAALFSALFRSRGGGGGVRRILSFYKDLNLEVRPKKSAGYQVSLVDYWGRAVAKRIFPAGSKVNVALSAVVSQPAFCNFSHPFPIFGAVERRPGVAESSAESHVFEFNPYEFGSWDSYLGRFVDVRYLGTDLWNGVSQRPTAVFNRSICVAGYDNLGLVIGTSSSLFNTFFAYVYRLVSQLDAQPSAVAASFLRIFGLSAGEALRHPEYALISPNPFRGVGQAPPAAAGRAERRVAGEQSLFLADGGDDGQNIPFHPLLVPGRAVEVILAYDASSDHDNFPNGSALVRTAARYHATHAAVRVPLFEHNGVLRRVFPVVPTCEEYRALGLGRQPVFLGCEMADYPEERAANATAAANSTARAAFELWPSYRPPLIVYFANHHHGFASNASTFRTVYTHDEVHGMLNNGYNVATRGNSTEFQTCLGCAMLKRRVGAAAPRICDYCYEKYCFTHRS